MTWEKTDISYIVYKNWQLTPPAIEVLQLCAHPKCLWCGAGQGSKSYPQLHSQASSKVESGSSWGTYPCHSRGTIPFCSGPLWGTQREGERGGWGENFLIFSGKDASLCALPLSIFKPFTVLKLASHWSHWSHWSSFTWFHRQLVGFQTSYHRRRLWDFFARISSPRLPFLLRVNGLFLFGILVGRVALPSLVSNEKVKEEPMVMENLNTLPWVMTCQCLAEVQSLVGHGGVTESVTLTAVIFGVYIWTFNFEVRKWNMLSLVCP